MKHGEHDKDEDKEEDKKHETGDTAFYYSAGYDYSSKLQNKFVYKNKK